MSEVDRKQYSQQCTTRKPKRKRKKKKSNGIARDEQTANLLSRKALDIVGTRKSFQVMFENVQVTATG